MATELAKLKTVEKVEVLWTIYDNDSKDIIIEISRWIGTDLGALFCPTRTAACWLRVALKPRRLTMATGGAPAS